MRASLLAVTQPEFFPRCISRQTYDDVTRLIQKAQVSLGKDRESACLSLTRALSILQQKENNAACAVGSLRDWEVSRLDDYIDSHLDVPIRTIQLASLLNLSPSRFSHAFKKTFGVVPLVYVAQRRIESARRLMLTTSCSLTEIAHSHGFCDQSHFIRTFRRQLGVTPHVWRRQRSKSPADDWNL